MREDYDPRRPNGAAVAAVLVPVGILIVSAAVAVTALVYGLVHMVAGWL